MKQNTYNNLNKCLLTIYSPQKIIIQHFNGQNIHFLTGSLFMIIGIACMVIANCVPDKNKFSKTLK